MTEDERRVRRAVVAIDSMVGSLERGDMDVAQQQFTDLHPLLHEIATNVERTNPDDAELLNDITEVVKIELTSDSTDLPRLVQLSKRMSEMFEAASFVVAR